MELLNQEKTSGKYTTMQNEDIDVVIRCFHTSNRAGLRRKHIKRSSKNNKNSRL